jgi:hypothetical protein
VAGYYSATQQHNAAAPLADFCTAAYTADRFDYGVLPPTFFRKLQETIFDRIRAKKFGDVPRTE